MPKALRHERQAVEAQIRDAFKDVTRGDGISWSEADVIDAYGSDEQCNEARALDNESGWQELVDDPRWGGEVSNWSFLDAAGFRYYVAPAMIRSCRSGWGELLSYQLERSLDDADYGELFTPQQLAAIARFVRYMIAVHDAQDDDIYGKHWKNAYNGIWSQWDSPQQE